MDRAVLGWLIVVGVKIAEKALIARVRRMVGGGKRTAIRTGIGDDCAVLRLGASASDEVLVTTDFSLEGIHFRREWHPARAVGHRCIARGLSDIAAMGGKPVAAFLSLALPREVPQKWVDDFSRGLLKLAEKYGVTLAGGDTAESPDGILADIVVVGSVPRGKAVLRSGARPGDRIYVSGSLGGSAAAVARMSEGATGKLNSKEYSRHFFPEPRIELGRVLREKKLVTAMIDTSDGLSTDLAHICEESGVGAEVWVEAIPRARVGRPAREVDLQMALHGGEDYELLFTARPGTSVPSRIAGVAIACLGEMTRGKKILLVQENGKKKTLEPKGWEHFRR